MSNTGGEKFKQSFSVSVNIPISRQAAERISRERNSTGICDFDFEVSYVDRRKSPQQQISKLKRFTLNRGDEVSNEVYECAGSIPDGFILNEFARLIGDNASGDGVRFDCELKFYKSKSLRFQGYPWPSNQHPFKFRVEDADRKQFIQLLDDFLEVITSPKPTGDQDWRRRAAESLQELQQHEEAVKADIQVVTNVFRAAIQDSESKIELRPGNTPIKGCMVALARTGELARLPGIEYRVSLVDEQGGTVHRTLTHKVPEAPILVGRFRSIQITQVLSDKKPGLVRSFPASETKDDTEYRVVLELSQKDRAIASDLESLVKLQGELEATRDRLKSNMAETNPGK